MSKKTFITILTFMMFPLFVTACGNSGTSISQEEYDKMVSEKSATQSELESVKNELENAQNELTSAKTELEQVTAEYNEYKEKMKPFEEMDAAEAEARKIAAEEEKAKKQEEEAQAAKKEAEKQAEKEKKGYDTGITYDNLARNPDDYKGEKVKFKGRVVQLMEDESEIQIRLAVDDDYDTILLCGYDPSIVSSRVLEDDMITIYGTSVGTISYESTLGGTITIPGVYVDKIDQ